MRKRNLTPPKPIPNSIITPFVGVLIAWLFLGLVAYSLHREYESRPSPVVHVRQQF